MIDERGVTIFRPGDWPILPVSRCQWYTIGEEAHKVTWRQWLWFVWSVHDEFLGERYKHFYYPRLMWIHTWMARDANAEWQAENARRRTIGY